MGVIVSERRLSVRAAVSYADNSDWRRQGAPPARLSAENRKRRFGHAKASLRALVSLDSDCRAGIGGGTGGGPQGLDANHPAWGKVAGRACHVHAGGRQGWYPTRAEQAFAAAVAQPALDDARRFEGPPVAGTIEFQGENGEVGPTRDWLAHDCCPAASLTHADDEGANRDAGALSFLYSKSQIHRFVIAATRCAGRGDIVVTADVPLVAFASVPRNGGDDGFRSALNPSYELALLTYRLDWVLA